MTFYVNMPRHPNGESFQNIPSVRQVAVSLPDFFRCVMADECLPPAEPPPKRSRSS